MLGLFAVLTFWTTAFLSLADDKIQVCFAGDGPTPYQYCIVRLPGHDPNQLLLHLHGRGLNEKIWRDSDYYTALMKEQWQRSHLRPPLIVTVSFGPFWLLAPQGDSKKSGLRELLLDKVLPAIESKLPQKPQHHWLLGESMGGFNAIQLLPSSRFEKVAILCPPVYELSYPFSFTRMMELILRTKMEWRVAWALWWIKDDFIQSSGDWEAVSPLAIAETLSPSTKTEIYLSCGMRDPYGNFPGVLKLRDVLISKKLKVQWHPLYARHCGIHIPSLAQFLSGTK